MQASPRKVFGALLALAILALLCACGSVGRIETPATSATRTQEPTSGLVTELRVLADVKRAVCPGSKFDPQGACGHGNCNGSMDYLLTCQFSATHWTLVWIRRYEKIEWAQSMFKGNTQGQPIHDFHGYPSVSWDEPIAGTDGGRRVWICEAEQWVFTVDSTDEGQDRIALEPGQVGEVLYRSALEHSLWQTH